MGLCFAFASKHIHFVYYSESLLFELLTKLSFVYLQISLSRKLDHISDDSFSATFVPLQISLASLIITSFYQKGGNHCKLLITFAIILYFVF